MYDKSKEVIRRANDFTGDEIFFKKELIIPDSSKHSLFNFTDGPINYGDY